MKIYKYGSDSQQYGQFFRPNSEVSVPVVIVIHGGYWKDNHSLDTYPTKHIVEYLLGLNVAVWNVEYRRMNSMGPNITAPWPTIFSDVAQGVDFLTTIAEQEKIDLKQVMIIGHSAGGHLATWAASRAMIDKQSELYNNASLAINTVISISGVLELRTAADLGQPLQIEKLLGGQFTRDHCRVKNANPSQLINNKVNYIIIHGDSDEEVSINQAASFVENSHSSNVLLHVLKGIGHFQMFPSFNKDLQSWQLVQQIITQNLQTS
ncbi:alpha/beta hydrolase [uncultured Pseudoalteromonas sp.]|uniref:alpha/beta hydrolase n=1 Tax=Pseudoalteromonas sp. 5-MNA-CIBAN-0065 TaxID=3140421 RepID=UPI0030D7460D